jgi:hypothetical protein
MEQHAGTTDISSHALAPLTFTAGPVLHCDLQFEAPGTRHFRHRDTASRV